MHTVSAKMHKHHMIRTPIYGNNVGPASKCNSMPATYNVHYIVLIGAVYATINYIRVVYMLLSLYAHYNNYYNSITACILARLTNDHPVPPALLGGSFSLSPYCLLAVPCSTLSGTSSVDCSWTLDLCRWKHIGCRDFDWCHCFDQTVPAASFHYQWPVKWKLKLD